MITLSDLLHKPPAGLDEIEPYPPEVWTDLQADEGLAQALCDSLYLQDTDPGSYEAAVLVGKGATVAAGELAALVPSIRHILILEPDVRMIRTLRNKIQKDDSSYPFPETTVLADVVGAEEGDYSVDAYLEILQFLLCANTSMDRVLLFFHTKASAAEPEYSPLVLAMEDLFWARSERFLDLIAEADALPSDLLSEWADFLLRTGQPFHAVKFYTLLAKHLGVEAVSERVTRAWIQCECYAALETWLPALGDGRTQHLVAGVARAVESCLGDQDSEAAACLAKNLAALAVRAPELAAELHRHVPDTALCVAKIDHAPWALSFRPPRISARAYWVLFRVEGARVREVNPFGNPRDSLAALKPYFTSADKLPGALLMGSTRRYGMLLCLHANQVDLQRQSETPPIYVAERDLDLLAVLLRRVDMSSLFSDDRVAFFLGEDAADSLERYLSPPSPHPLPAVRVDVPLALAERVNGISAAQHHVRSLPHA